MNKIIPLFILVLSFSFAGTIWVAAGTSANFDYSNHSYIPGYDPGESWEGGAPMDNSGLEIGYYNILGNNRNMSWGVGGSYHLTPMTLESVDGDEEDDFEIGFLSFYGLLSFPITKGVATWFSLGFGVPQYDIDDADPGLVYSFGFTYRINDKMLVGLGYTKNSSSKTDENIFYSNSDEFTEITEFDWGVSRMTLNFGYSM